MKSVICLFILAVAAGAFALPAFAQDQLGVPLYPNATPMPEVVTRLMESKGSTWTAAAAFRTDDPIKVVVKFFREQAAQAGKPAVESEHVRRLLLDNWKIIEPPLTGVNEVFGVNEKLRGIAKEKVKTTFGAILVNDSFVRVHIVSPYPVPPDGMTVADGTMIVMIRERLTNLADTSSEVRVYNGNEVTRKAIIRTSPPPELVQGVHGTVRLKAKFGADGKVDNIVIIQDVQGLTEMAIKAARQITFDPAIKDGRYVSMWMQLEYNFN